MTLAKFLRGEPGLVFRRNPRADPKVRQKGIIASRNLRAPAPDAAPRPLVEVWK